MATNAEVERWLDSSDHPLKDAIRRVREIVLGCDERVGECIKWKSPTFTYRGNIASINPNTRKKVSLMFHRGAEIPGEHPRLVGGAGTVRYMYFSDRSDVEAQRRAIESVIRAWCALKTPRQASGRAPGSGAPAGRPRARKTGSAGSGRPARGGR